MSLTLLSHYHNDKGAGDFQKLADITLPIRDRYCAKWGFKHHVHQGDYKDGNLYYAIQRLHLLHDLMKADLATEWWWVLNIQAVITNHTRNVLDFTDQFHDFFIARDVSGINAGSFIVRNTERGREWIDFIAHDAPHRPEWQQFEQNSIAANIRSPRFIDICCEQKQSLYNSYDYRMFAPNWGEGTPGHWKSGDLVLSQPGRTLEQKLATVSSKEVQDSIIWG